MVSQDHVTNQKHYISTPQCLWPPNLAEWWLTLMGNSQCYSTLGSSHVVRRLRDKLKWLYLHDDLTYGYLTWQGYDFKSHDLLIPRSCEIMWQSKTFISELPQSMSMGTKLSRLLNYFEWLLLIKSHDHIITRSCEITRQTKNISPLPHCLWPQNLAGWWWLTLSDFYRHMTI